MNEPETIKSAVETIANHPTIASAVAVTTSASGAIAIMSQVQTVLGIISLCIGCVVGLFVIRCHHLKAKLMQRAWENGKNMPEEAS